MRPRSVRLFHDVLVRAIASGVVLSSAATAMADVTRLECVKANAEGQALRREGRFAAARERLRMCNDPACPAVISDDCTRRLDELEAAQPTIILGAKDRGGHDLSAVEVTMDGHPFAEKLVGAPIEVDRGEHAFTFTADGLPPLTFKLVIMESERSRHERVMLGAPQAVAPEPEPTAPRTEPHAPEPHRPVTHAPEPHGAEPLGAIDNRRVVGLFAGGAGLAAFVVGGVFGALTMNAVAAQKADCPSATSCPRPAQAVADHATWTNDGNASTIALVTGAALVGGGAVLFFTGHRPSNDHAGASLGLVPGVAPGRAGLVLQGEF